MSLFKIAVPSVVGGISQQPEAMARPDKAKDIENFIPYPEAGLTRRSGTRHLATPYTAPLDAFLLPIDIGGDEKYVAAISNENVRVFLSNGEEIVVKKVNRDANGAITGGAAPDFAYLNLRTLKYPLLGPLHHDHPEKFYQQGWVISGAMSAVTGITPAVGPASPLGWKASAKIGAEAFAKFIDNGTGGEAFVTSVANGAYTGQRIRLSIYINTNTAFGAFANADRVGLMVKFGAKEYHVKWDFGGSYNAVPTVVQSSSDGSVFRTSQEKLGTNLFRLSILYDPDRVVGAKPANGDLYNAVISLSEGPGGGTGGGWYAWGVLLEETNVEDDPTPGAYAHPTTDLRWVQAVATIFGANPHVSTRVDTTKFATTLANVYGNITFTGVGGGANENNIPVSDAAYYFVKQGAKDSKYTWRLKVRDTTGGGIGTIDFTNTVTRAAAATDDDTEAIAIAIRDQINTHASNTDGGAGGNQARIVEADAVGPVVRLRAKGGGGVNMVFDLVEAHDTLGDLALIGFHDEVDTISKLPLTATDGTRVRLAQQSERPTDFPVSRVVLRFRADQDGLFTTGLWEEGTEYKSVVEGTTVDFLTNVLPSTLPHVLVRRQDNAAGLVTGASSSLYFEWGPHTWDARLVGDDLTNPIPSFVTPQTKEGINNRYVTAISFYKGRLIIGGSDQSVSMSEVSRYGNFFRTTIQALPQSDRIDMGVSSVRGAAPTDMIVAGERLFVQAGESILVVTSGDVLGPRSVGLDTVYVGSVSSRPQSSIALTGFVFVAPGDDHESLFMAVPSEESDLIVGEPSDEAHRLLASPITRLQWSPKSSIVFCSSENGANIYGLRILPGQNGPLQSAWFRMTFGGGTVHSFAVLGNEVFALIHRKGVIHLERMPLDRDPRDIDTQEWSIRLDRRLSDEDLTVAPTYAAGPDQTTFTLPYDIEANAVMSVVRRTGATNFGLQLTVVSTGTNTVVVSGNFATTAVFIGQRFTSTYLPLRPLPRVSATGRGFYQPVTAREVVRRGTATFSRSAQAKVEVTDAILNVYTDELDTETNRVELVDQEIRFGVFSEAEAVVVSIKSDEHKPCNLTGLEWEVELVDRGARLRS